VFDLVAESAGVSRDELRSTLNLGIGLVLVVGRGHVGEVVRRAEREGTQAFAIGVVVAGEGLRFA
jgi:phosphoribosylformylglycinamidine cyclo-ligase